MAERYPTSLKLDASLKLRVQRLALAHGRTAHGLLCDAIRAFVEQEELRLAAQEAAAPAPDEHGEPDAHNDNRNELDRPAAADAANAGDAIDSAGST